MAHRKQRINVMFEADTVEELVKQIPEKQRSDFIEQQVRKGLGMPEAETGQKGFAVYEKDIDHGQGVQVVYVNDGRVVSQSIQAKPGFYHSYTGDGNPEWVGQKVNVIYGRGFKRLRGSRVSDSEMDWMQSEMENYE